jgi:hypothetical protein
MDQIINFKDFDASIITEDYNRVETEGCMEEIIQHLTNLKAKNRLTKDDRQRIEDAYVALRLLK